MEIMRMPVILFEVKYPLLQKTKNPLNHKDSEDFYKIDDRTVPE